MEFAAIVLAGGAGRRMGDAAKPLRRVAGESMLARVLAAVGDASPRIVVGPPTLRGELPSGIIVTTEVPPGGGPVPAAAAGLAILPPGTRTVALLAADLPFLTAATVALLRHGHVSSTVDGAVLVDAAGREQWLCGVWRVAALRRAYGHLPEPNGVSLRHFMRDLRIHTVVAPADPAGTALATPGAGAGCVPWFDCDTEDDLRRAEELAHGRER